MAEKILAFFSGFIKNPAVLTFVVAAMPVIELKGAIPIGYAMGVNPFLAYLLAFAGSTLPAVPIIFLLNPVLDWMGKKKPFVKMTEKLRARFAKGAGRIERRIEMAEAGGDFGAGIAAESIAAEGTATAGVTTGGVATAGITTAGISTGGIVSGDMATGSISTGGIAEGAAAAEDKRRKRAERIKFWTVLAFVAIPIPLPLTGVWTGSAVTVFSRMKKSSALLAVAIGNAISGLAVVLISLAVGSFI